MQLFMGMFMKPGHWERYGHNKSYGMCEILFCIPTLGGLELCDGVFQCVKVNATWFLYLMF